MSKYPEVVGQLVSAAYDQGMSKQTQVYAVADGVVTRSAASKVSNLTFILTVPISNNIFTKGQKRLDLQARSVTRWVASFTSLLWEVRQVIKTLKGYRGQGQERITNLFQYLKRLEMLSIMTTSVPRFTHQFGRGWKRDHAIFAKSSRFQGRYGTQIQ